MTSDTSWIRAEVLRRYLARGRDFVFRTSGCSMLSVIRPGDLLHVAYARSFRRGDILVFDQNGTLVVHRLVRIEQQDFGDQRLVFRGDNQLRSDAPVRREAVVGRVFRVERGGQIIRLDGWWGRLNLWLASASLFGRPAMPLLRGVLSRGRHLESLWHFVRPRLKTGGGR
jgi:Peptidase S24-like